MQALSLAAMTATPRDDHQMLFSRFRVLEVVADDPVERVVRCLDTGLGREVLLESPGSSLDAVPTADGSARALREARLLAGLNHRGLPRVHDVLLDERGPVLVLEAVNGETLASRLERSGPLDAAEIRRLALDLASALAAVHGARGVHRALSTRNVVIRQDGSAFLRGFRFAKFVAPGQGFSSIAAGRSRAAGSAEQRDARTTNPAPEQFGGASAGSATDLFALGCVLYEAASGVPPFGDRYTAGWHAPKPLRQAAPHLESDVTAVIEQCLARTAAGRPGSAESIVRSLGGASAGSAALELSGRRRLVIAAVLVLVVALAAVLAARRNGHDDQAPNRNIGPRVPRVVGPAEEHYNAGFDRSHALLIGISDYAHFRDLPNAAEDVQKLALRLRELPGAWEVTLLPPEQSTKEMLERALVEFESKLTERPDDRALVYYAGHGERHKATHSYGWLVPSDGLPGDRVTWIEFNKLELLFEGTRAKHVLVALDCCFGGVLAAMRGGGDGGFYDVRHTREKAHVVLTSGRAAEEVTDGVGGENSPFARGFLDALNSDRPALTSSGLYGSILDAYERQGVRSQAPMLDRRSGSGTEFIFHLRQ